MARVTVEDCVTVIPNRFELVLLAAQRARDIAAGVDMTVERDNDKNAVVALREIAEQSINFDELRRHIAKGVNRHDDLNIEDDTLLALTQESMPAGMDQDAGEIEEIAFEDETEEEVTVEAAAEESAEDVIMTGEDLIADIDSEIDIAEVTEDGDELSA